MDIQSSLQGLPFTVEGTGFAALLEQTENSGGCACTENKGYNCQEMKGGGGGGRKKKKYKKRRGRELGKKRTRK